MRLDDAVFATNEAWARKLRDNRRRSTLRVSPWEDPPAARRDNSLPRSGRLTLDLMNSGQSSSCFIGTRARLGKQLLRGTPNDSQNRRYFPLASTSDFAFSFMVFTVLL